jgi:5-methylcytosine-specific restriction endonuclease McrA
MRLGLCNRCYKRAYYLAHREHLIARTAAWQKANPEADAAHRERSKPQAARYRKVYGQVNAVRIAAYNKAYREAHLDQERARQKTYLAGRHEQSRAMRKAWKLANPDRASENNRQQISRRRARKNGAIVTKADYRAILAEHGMRCHICGLDILTRADLHFDHVIPLAKGGAHSAENIRPSHALCNQRKSDKVA